ncbi:hypothetical protein FTUN_1387 [Frigoriglobus tundricola]|uniref:Uncharacterized protein n=1 Tax=Frigoriglobus tundricola TaxID=2774151 RepID=A0A6M5YKR7_9BACT|nr:hypothetical protein FTUN_1387 [Frigoriglobus tundricola]
MEDIGTPGRKIRTFSYKWYLRHHRLDKGTIKAHRFGSR